MSMLGRTSPTSEPGTPRAMVVQHGWRHGLSACRQLTATIVRGVVATDEWDGKNAGGLYCNTCWSSNKATGIYVGGLEFTCQTYLPAADRTYGNQYNFAIFGNTVDAREAHAMSKTFTRLAAAHERLVQAEGHVSSGDYAHFLLRNAAILGCTQFLFPVHPTDKHLTLDKAGAWNCVSKRSDVYAEVQRLLAAFRPSVD